MNIQERIDKRIESLETARKGFLKEKNTEFANSTWARLDELKTLKKEFTDKDGNWKEIS